MLTLFAAFITVWSKTVFPKLTVNLRAVIEPLLRIVNRTSAGREIVLTVLGGAQTACNLAMT